METSFRNLDRAIESQPMPAGFRDTKALVYCNDCCAKSSVPYHWLGLRCGLCVHLDFVSCIRLLLTFELCRCDSYNTAQIKIFNGPAPDYTLQTPPRSADQENMHATSSSLPAQDPRPHSAAALLQVDPDAILDPLTSSVSSPPPLASASSNLPNYPARATAGPLLSPPSSLGTAPARGIPSALHPPYSPDIDTRSFSPMDSEDTGPSNPSRSGLSPSPDPAPSHSLSISASSTTHLPPNVAPIAHTSGITTHTTGNTGDDDEEDEEDINFWGEDVSLFGPMMDIELLHGHGSGNGGDEAEGVSSLVSINEDDEDEEGLYDLTTDDDDDYDDDDEDKSSSGVDGTGDGDDEEEEEMELIGHR